MLDVHFLPLNFLSSMSNTSLDQTPAPELYMYINLNDLSHVPEIYTRCRKNRIIDCLFWSGK